MHMYEKSEIRTKFCNCKQKIGTNCLRQTGKTPGEAVGFYLSLKEWDLESSGEDMTVMGAA